MDKQKIMVYQKELYTQLLILYDLYNESKERNILEIKTALHYAIAEKTIEQSLLQLVSYGLVVVSSSGRAALLYKLSPFGKYFCQQCKAKTGNIAIE